MSKIVLPYTVNWGEGTYPVSGDLWSGQPVRQAPAVRYFTPNERAATPLINYALWESQEAARRISDALVVADLEGGICSRLRLISTTRPLAGTTNNTER